MMEPYAEKSSGGYTPRWNKIVLIPYSKNSVTNCHFKLALTISNLAIRIVHVPSQTLVFAVCEPLTCLS